MPEYLYRESKAEKAFNIIAISVICILLAILLLQPVLRSYDSFKDECDKRGGVIIHRAFVDACESRLD